MDSGLDSVAFSNSSEDVNFIQDSSPNFREVRNKKNNALLRQILLSGLVLVCFMICIVILIWCNWLKIFNSIHTAAATNSTLCSTSTPTYKTELEMELRRRFVREMMLDSWKAYEQSAWRHEALGPVSKTAYNGRFFWDIKFGNDSGLSIFASMSTLWTMGLREEFQKGKNWIETELDLGKLNRSVYVFDVVTHYDGGLLSCYALTNDSMFLIKANEIAQLVEPAFNTTTGMPYRNINLNSSELSGKNSHISYISGFQIDFNYLSDAANETKYRNMIYRIRQNLREIEKHMKNLYYNLINIENNWIVYVNCLYDKCREFYISLAKSYIQSNHLDVQSIEMYKEAMDAVEAVKMIYVSSDGMYYAREYGNYSKDEGMYSEDMRYGTCYLGAMLSMGANAMQQALNMNKLSIGINLKSKELHRIHHHWELAEKLTETCHVASSLTRTGLGPYTLFKHTYVQHAEYRLSPEFAESNFVLWHLTHDPKYRDYAWEMTLAIKRFCRVESGGYSGIDNVDRIPTSKDNHQHPEFLSATLKYLYLTFTDDDVLPLDQWVFNAQGHPLPICGKNPAYPLHMCKNY